MELDKKFDISGISSKSLKYKNGPQKKVMPIPNPGIQPMYSALFRTLLHSCLHYCRYYCFI